MKRWRWGAVVSCLILAVLVLGQGNRQRKVCANFVRNQITFEQTANEVLRTCSGFGVDVPIGVSGVAYYPRYAGGEHVVEFLFGSDGLGSGSRYWGINYVEADEPIPFQAGGWEYWRPEGGGRLYYEIEGENTCYVERIAPCWYYFEARL